MKIVILHKFKSSTHINQKSIQQPLIHPCQVKVYITIASLQLKQKKKY